MKRVVTFVLLLVCIAGSVFAGDTKNLTVTLNVTDSPTFGFAKVEVSKDAPNYILADSEELISELNGRIYASAVTAAYGNVTLTVTYDTALKGQKVGNTYTIDLTLKNGENAGLDGEEGKKVITLTEAPEKYQKRAINYPLEISYDTAQAADAPVDTYEATLTLAYSAT